MAGILIGTAKETQWVHHTLESFKVLFVSLFFVSIGMLLDLHFLLEHWFEAFFLMTAAVVTNTLINAFVLRLAKFGKHESLYAGLLLSQIGEFSFVLAQVGFQSKIINSTGYQLALCVISLSLLFSPVWINSVKKILQLDYDARDIHQVQDKKGIHQ
jgi:CPA2 family monovalent cation:H+ antiporter-2